MTDTTRLLIELAVILLSAGLVGTRVAAEARKRETIYSGAAGQVLNLISSMAVSALLPGLIVGLILGSTHFVLPVMLTLLSTILVSLVIFALIEMPKRKQAEALQPELTEDDLWTAEKARTSGL
jgi:type III secretory pathway component EscV